MKKMSDFNRNLSLCYTRVKWDSFFKLSDDDKESLCREEREALINHINSDEMTPKSILNDYVKAVRERFPQIPH